VLELFVGEAHQCLERGLVAEPVVAAHFRHLRADEALDEAEHVGVGAALHLAEEALLLGLQERQPADHRQAVGQELPAEVEPAAADDVAVDLEAHALGNLDGLRVAVGLGLHRFYCLHCLHDSLLRLGNGLR
jgi:hypothetical protein